MSRAFLFLAILLAIGEARASSNNPEPRWSGYRHAADWTRAVQDSLLGENRALLDSTPKDVERFCPRFASFNREERLRFWTQLVSAMAEKESDFQESQTYRENFYDTDGTRVVSRGLLQISFTSAKLYHCPITKASDLQKAEPNLRCGLKIIRSWVLKDGRIGGGDAPWRGVARYWGVFRQRRKFQHIQSTVYNMSLCRQKQARKEIAVEARGGSR